MSLPQPSAHPPLMLKAQQNQKKADRVKMNKMLITNSERRLLQRTICDSSRDWQLGYIHMIGISRKGKVCTPGGAKCVKTMGDNMNHLLIHHQARDSKGCPNQQGHQLEKQKHGRTFLWHSEAAANRKERAEILITHASTK
ncbi:hypothetical protein H5410_030481 [Solanum commersonii]|uniref:Uncharacterized protein n=1 Tax=Solanum commersonii TaxID=4109 RepID=A0A9J5YH04_SOLCO|nr:hypothetical protein H5410_030481 [Solanum commersonii]